MRILKFGGSSVGTPEKIKNVCKIVCDLQEKQGPLAVVVSAFQGVTDQLIETSKLAASRDEQYKKLLAELEEKHINFVKELVAIQNQSSVLAEVKLRLNELEDVLRGVELIGELSDKSLDFVMSFGERLSAYIISQAFAEFDLPAQFLDTRDLIKTDNSFSSAWVDLKKSYQNLKDHFAGDLPLQVITGFIGSTDKNETTTLGRGGSDYTASLLAAALQAAEVQIWTDVDGVLTANPKQVAKAFPQSQLTYAEAMELSHFGAKVIYPPTMQPCMEKNIPIRIKNTFNPQFAGTVIGGESKANGHLIKGISSISDIALLRVQGSGIIGVVGIASRLFGALAKESINVILITQASSEHSICLAIEAKQSHEAKKAIEEEFDLEIKAGQFDEVIVENSFSIVAIVGENMKKQPGVSARLFSALGKNGINIVAIAQGSSELNISVVISKKDEAKALNAIHQTFFLSDEKTLPIFLVGPGLVGETFLKQVDEQLEYLEKGLGLEVNLVGIANSSKMLFDPAGISLIDWQNKLAEKGEPMSLRQYVDKMKDLGLANSVFVDCTASAEVVKYYVEILQAGISIVTPNKKANSGSWQDYLAPKLVAQKTGTKFLYETNVGAGLPVISTMHDLLMSGDKIEKVEGVLSGTLSYIFNSFDGSKKFSEIVKEAQQKGYTEPDPRDDLNGLDVARKLLILAREIGLEFEMENIEVENLVPESCRQAGSVEEFFSELKKHDDYFAEKIKKASGKGKALRYIATLEGERAKVSLKEVDANHPFYFLSGSDNMVVFTTKRYNKTPLVVRGPGAGAEVTAAGVLADVLKTVG